jgi:hypothetical protein
MVQQPAPKGFPDSLVIRGQVWEVCYFKGLRSSEDQKLLGECRPEEHRVFIETEQCRDVMEETLLHEAYHAYCRAFPILGVTPEQEEALADHFSAVLSDLTRFNKAWFPLGQTRRKA